MKKIISSVFVCCLFYSVFAQSGISAFTASSFFIVPDGVTTVFIQAIGAGGNGGINGTGGGGGGGYASGYYAVTPGQVLEVMVGTAGGGAFAVSKVDFLLSASGGENGISVPNPEIGGGGAGGVGLGGNTANFVGGNGGGGYYTYFGGGGGGAAGIDGNGYDGGNTIAWTGICLTPGGASGLNGGYPGGDGGKGAGFTDASCNITDPAAGGLNYGGGGGGGNGNGGGPGAGAGGYCIISWCDIDATTSLAGETITANATALAYQWIDCSTGLAIDGEINQTFTATANGNYAVIVTDAVCADTSECVAITTVIEESIQNSNSYTAYINPFSARIVILNTIGSEIYSLMNANGQLIWTGIQIEQHDFSSLPAGNYLLKVQSVRGVGMVQLMKE